MENTPTTHKKEIKKAWLFTIILHLLIAGVLITYWYFNQSKKPDPVATLQSNTQPAVPASTFAPLPPLKTGLASAPTATPNTASTATATAKATVASTAMTASTVVATQKPTPTTQTDTAIADKQRPLSKYVSTQTQTNNDKTVVQERVATAPVHQALTSRDVPRNEAKATTIAQTNTDTPAPAPVKSKADTKAQQKAEQQEVVKLNKEVEQENDKISQLIEQVKNQNQRKIEENIAKNQSTKTDNKPAPKAETSEKTEKVEKAEKPKEKSAPTEEKSETPSENNP